MSMPPMIDPSVSIASTESSFVSPSGRSSRGSHQLAAALACERLWYLRYSKRLIGHSEKSFRLAGTLIHLAMAYYYASKMVVKPQFFLNQDLRSALEEKARGSPALVQRTMEILVSYMTFFVDDPWVPIHIEEEFRARIGDLDEGGPDPSLDGEFISCRPDLIVRMPDNTNWIVDHKSQGRGYGGSSRMEKWNVDNEFALNWQILVNLHVVRQHMPIQGFIIQRIKREPPYDFDRNIVRVSGAAYGEAPRVARALVARERHIIQQAAMGIPPLPSIGMVCTGRYGNCDYRPVCISDTHEQRLRVIQDEYSEEK